jgi:hypothetical protein
MGSRWHGRIVADAIRDFECNGDVSTARVQPTPQPIAADAHTPYETRNAVNLLLEVGKGETCTKSLRSRSTWT